MPVVELDRRSFLNGSIAAAAALLAGCRRDEELVTTGSFAGGKRLEVVEWPDDDPPPFGTAVGQGWDGRRYLDLSQLDPDAPRITATERFFVRSFVPDSLAGRSPGAGDWLLRVGGLAGPDALLPLASLRPRALGRVLIECAGNDASARFGLMSCADWDGVSLLEVLAELPKKAGAGALRVSGVDDHSVASRGAHSKSGAAWVFDAAQLAQSGAFLATGMNGAPLAPEHGAPVRLVVPGWYGCTHIKWVDALAWVGADEPATAQMQEFARRTHQQGVPALARDFRPAAIDAAALPVRVERWRVGGKTSIRVVGIVWGGDGSERSLRIRVDPGGRWERVALPASERGRAWEVWEHGWRPARSGSFAIRCRFDGGVAQRRQAAGFHDRTIRI